MFTLAGQSSAAEGWSLTFQTARRPGQTFIPHAVKAAHVAAALLFGCDDSHELGLTNDTQAKCDSLYTSEPLEMKKAMDFFPENKEGFVDKFSMRESSSSLTENCSEQRSAGTTDIN